jgi:hypothetical protein
MARHFPRRNKFIAQEIIAQQDNSFGIHIESKVTDIQNLIDPNNTNNLSTNEEILKYCKDIESMIHERVGLQVDLIPNQHLASILAVPFTKSHIFNTPSLFKVATEEDKYTGYVDLNKAKVGGIFSKFKNKLFINFVQMTIQYKLSPGEITAVILHELGHAFGYCEFSDRLETTNQILANVTKEMSSSKKDKDLTYVFKELSSLDAQVTEEDVQTLLTGPKVIVGYKLFKIVIDSLSSQMTASLYDKTSSEQTADQFVARFGYGKQLIIASDKLEVYFRQEINASKNAFNYLMTSIYGFAVACGIIATWAAVFPAAILFGLMFILIVAKTRKEYAESIRSSGDLYADFAYDDVKARYKRIRNEYIDLIKDTDIPKDELKAILDSIYAMDDIINKTVEYKSIFNIISNALFKENRDAKKAVDEQKLMEQLAHNDLFLKSAELRSI